MKRKRLSEQNKLRLIFILGVASILLIAVFLVAVLQYVFVEVKIVSKLDLEGTSYGWIIMIATTSIILGLGLTFIFVRFVLRPYYKLLDGLEKLSKGEFSARIDASKFNAVKSVSEKFNVLAEELEKTEILRSDFINDFSHEFKTPIVSLKSLVTLMKKGDLPKDKQQQYLLIIEEEINRLSDMTTNILNLTKIENQGILTGKTEYNLSEQLRKCLVLHEKNWAKKGLNLDVDFSEYFISANEDMLKQVWINLLDNAIKFSFKGGELKIAIENLKNQIVVSISNEGPEIPEEDYEKIFQKFYQTKYTSKKEGNGIGLSIVSHIVKLHRGTVSAKSNGGVTTFTVTLPA